MWLCCAQPQYIPHIFSWLTFFQGSQPLITRNAKPEHGGKTNRVTAKAGGRYSLTIGYNSLHADHLGSTSLTTDAAGDVVARRRYHPYGDERYVAGDQLTDFGFPGRGLRPPSRAMDGAKGCRRHRADVLPRAVLSPGSALRACLWANDPRAGALRQRGYDCAGTGESAEPESICVCDE